VAPALVVWLYHTAGGWRPAFLITGTLGFLWLIAWRMLYHPPETHPRIDKSEREMILKDRVISSGPAERPRWAHLLKQPGAWAAIAARSLTDPVWFFVADWFAIYLVSKGFNVEEGLMAFWIPFIAADLGNFAGGGVSSWLIRRGWSVEWARKAVVIPGGLGMMLLIPTIYTSNLFMIAGLFGLATFSYAAFSTIAITLPADLFPGPAVATVAGMSGAGAGIGTIASTYVIGYVSDRYSFEPILIGASLVPLLGVALVLLLVRPRR
jgi:ACS family hexuronate transporter-like MFS transporter